MTPTNNTDDAIVIDRGRRHIRTPGGTVIPFFVARLAISFAALTIAVAVTFGVPIWLFIAAAIWAARRLGIEIHNATWRHNTQPNRNRRGTTN